MRLFFKNQTLIWLYAIVIVLLITNATCDIFEECNNVSEGSFIAGSKNCSHYIYCDDEDSTDGYCEGAYNNDLQMCEAPSDNCRNNADNNNNTIITPTPNPSVSNTTGSTALTTTLPGPTTIITSNTTADFIIATVCPNIDDDHTIVFLLHETSCSDYYVCYHGQSIPMHCSSMLHFDSKSGKCDYPQIVKCQADIFTPKEQCTSHTQDLYPHAGNCNYYYFCINGFLMLQQCPFHFGWDYESRTCISMKDAKCYNNGRRI